MGVDHLDFDDVLVRSHAELESFVVNRVFISLTGGLSNIDVDNSIIHRPFDLEPDIRAEHIGWQVSNLDDIEKTLPLERHLFLVRGARFQEQFAVLVLLIVFNHLIFTLNLSIS